MNIIKSAIILTVISLSWIFVACGEDADCPDCGKLTEGYLFKKVTQNDFAQFSGISGIEVDACMRYKVTSGTDISEGTISIVDDCCCE
ncbi:MAG: hypothetical protein CMG71_06630 [Candidatus Marinimicrobia bacterium]|nr:hypothetical protein [Candidatus Neomarinimicrobiota bacterium]|tara:strand:+ start:19300 stop:19563 length:264 start_codon:yes stop_codon:yes gene_type:complete